MIMEYSKIMAIQKGKKLNIVLVNMH